MNHRGPRSGLGERRHPPAALAGLVNELLKNVDAFAFSTFMSKERGEKLRLGPVWDFDLSMEKSSARGRAFRRAGSSARLGARLAWADSHVENLCGP